MASALILDSVSTILLMTPGWMKAKRFQFIAINNFCTFVVVIRICEVTNLNPVQVLTIMILAVNVGSTASPVGNPPNVMIINDPFIKTSVSHYHKLETN